ncbi:MAG: hypothetical protein JSR26_03870 [Proteobacteria bacterium]|nr:hypothetical protein [Pseudomonadota bacterium]
MAYIVGTAASIADLLAAIRGGCTANGWALSGTVLHAGACYLDLQVSGQTLVATGGTGIDGSNTLTGDGPAPVYLGAPLGGEPLSWPLTYHLHVFANEVYALINWGTAWTYLAFGASPAAGLPGTGGWYTASYCARQADVGYGFLWRDSGNVEAASSIDYFAATGPFWTSCWGAPVNSYVHHGLDGGGWSAVGDHALLVDGSARAAPSLGALLARQPNAWNGEAVLLPFQPLIDRGSNHASVVVELANARAVNIANYDPTNLIDLSPDKWMVYPFYRKGSAFLPDSFDSGYLGWAIRYDGP